MVLQKLLLLVTSLCLVLAFVNGECAPRSVHDLVLKDGILSWIVSPEEICDITHFRVNINRGFETYELIVEETTADVKFLPYCDTWTFSVRAISDAMVSPPHTLITRIPKPPDANLTLEYVRVIRRPGEFLLMWNLDREFQKCADSFRITVIDEEIDFEEDYYLERFSMDLSFISPCVVYEFGVRAIYKSDNTIEGPMKSTEVSLPPLVQDIPQLASVELGPTSANLTWNMDSVTKNRCPVRAFHVDGGRYFNVSLELEDQFDRQPVKVQLNRLHPNSMYVLRVRAENTAGLSRAAVVGIQTLDLQPTL